MTNNSTIKTDLVPSHPDFYDAPVVTLYVGANRKAFHVHLNLLCSASPFFKAAFSGNFKEASEHSIDLPEDDYEAVNRLVQWLYSKDYELPEYETPYSSKRHEALVVLYILGDKYDIIRLKNSIVKESFRLLEEHKIVPSIGLVKKLYQITKQGSRFRQFLVDCHSGRVTHKYFRNEDTQRRLAEIPDFAADVVCAMARRLEYPRDENPLDGDRTEYYEGLEGKDFFFK